MSDNDEKLDAWLALAALAITVGLALVALGWMLGAATIGGAM